MTASRPESIIDSHQHVFWQGRDDRGLIADMDEHGIDQAWLMTWNIGPWEEMRRFHRFLDPCNLRADGSHAGIPLQDLVRARDRYPDRFILGYCPNPVLGDGPSLLRAAVSIHDVRVCGEWKYRLPFDDPRCIEIFRTAGELRLPVVLHLDVPYLKSPQAGWEYQEMWFGGTVDNLERALIACPETIFVGHAPGFWREISADAVESAEAYPKGPVRAPGRLYGLFDRYPNLYADLSAGSGRTALNRDPEHAKGFVERFQDRLLFGRDIYGQELHRFLQTLQLSPEVSNKIYGGNARKVVRPDSLRPSVTTEIIP